MTAPSPRRPSPFRSRIRAKLRAARWAPVWLLTGGFLLVYNAIIGFQLHRDYQQAVETAALKADSTARLLAGEIGNYLEFTSASLETLDVLVGMLPPITGSDESVDIVTSLMKAKTRRLSLVRGYIITDASGRMIMDETGRPRAPLDLSDRDYVKAQAIGSGSRVFVGEPVVGRTSGLWFSSVSRRRENPDRSFAGVVAAVVEPSKLGQALAAADLGRHGVAALVTPTGTIIARSVGHDGMIGRNVADDAAFDAEGRASGAGRMVFSTAVLDLPASVMVSLDRGEIVAPWRASLPYYILAMALPSLSILMAFAIATRQHRALKESETTLQRHVRDLNASRQELERQALVLSALAEQNAAAKLKAESANMSKSLFLANMSHELRTPLNSIIGFAELIESEARDPVGRPDYGSYAADIRAGGQHLLDMINDILDLSRIEADKYVLRREPVSLARLLHACVSMLRVRIEEAGVALDNRIAAAPPAPLAADERAVKQVLINLLSNAVKFSRSGGAITLDAVAEGAFLRVTVADTGIGIPAEDLPRLGQPFEQAGSLLRDKPAGTGLGLALSQRLVELHGGTLTIDSVFGAGTTVAFTLPLRDGAARTAKEWEAASAAST